MQFDEYQQKANRTAIYMTEIRAMAGGYGDGLGNPQTEMLLRLSYVALGLAGEAGEFANKVKKLIRDNQGHLTDKRAQELSEELGGVLWYASQSAKELGRTLDSIARENLDILADRKKRGVIHGAGDDR